MSTPAARVKYSAASGPSGPTTVSAIFSEAAKSASWIRSVIGRLCSAGSTAVQITTALGLALIGVVVASEVPAGDLGNLDLIGILFGWPHRDINFSFKLMKRRVLEAFR